MWEFLSPPTSDLAVVIAAWTAATATFTSLVLFGATLALRFATVQRTRRRRRVIERWREVFAATIVASAEADLPALPRYRDDERMLLLEEWNRLHEAVDGIARDRLARVARRLGFADFARRKLRRRWLSERLAAIQTLGNLREIAEWENFIELLDHPNTALSITAAKALVQIDRSDAVRFVMPHVVARDDWPQATVMRILREAGAELVTRPLCNAILTADADTAVRLLKYTGVAQSDMIDQLVELLLRERKEPAVLTAAMRALGSGSTPPRTARLTEHDVWYVRMEAAKLLGRIGQPRDLPVLEALLGDREWWVRYRAAQAIVALPGLEPAALRALARRQQDSFASDMMQQAMAEAGIA
jgi:hypothetical protein